MNVPSFSTGEYFWKMKTALLLLLLVPVVRGIEPQAFNRPGKCSATELHSQPLAWLLFAAVSTQTEMKNMSPSLQAVTPGSNPSVLLTSSWPWTPY